MQIQETRSELIQRYDMLNLELVSIHDEIKLLRCLQKKVAKDISVIEHKLHEREDNNRLNCVNI